MSAQRAIFHGVLLLHCLEPVSIRAVSPVHVSISLYHAALAWYYYLQLAPADRAYARVVTIEEEEEEEEEFRKFTYISINTGDSLLEAPEFKIYRPCAQDSTVLAGLIDMLNRISYWGSSRSLASFLTLLAANSTENTGQLFKKRAVS
ncbi:uncharacterized protein BO97DRAFT_428779 [Aspergillus homomorphus CBS 101889]|uniref:Uncharacterized protein n=1 Tax=Aspergillus homomorphus (strain CBS 101889) TaxID=1450537 RepID=A0A395HJJ2_ASPHC|nr:hypothetical protein BO97DRAFT_428779 [Aspergillus homomorphus CBS 101889]RAL08081.1 hypothetical protein BO97DRAFT_428779 [Aspergillus homomorphus CBS 101889]